MSKTVIYSNGSQNGGFDPGVGYSFSFLFYLVTNPVDQQKKKDFTEFHTQCLPKKFSEKYFFVFPSSRNLECGNYCKFLF